MRLDAHTAPRAKLPPIEPISTSTTSCFEQLFAILASLWYQRNTHKFPFPNFSIMSSQRSQRTHKTRKGGATATNAKQIADPAVVKQDINQVFARVIGALKITVLVGATSLATVASRQALHPLYGSTASSYYFRHILAVSCLLSAASPLVPAHRLFLIQSVLLAVAPLSAKHLGIWFGRWGNAVWGAVLTQIPLTASFTALSCIIAKGWLVSHGLGERLSSNWFRVHQTEGTTTS